MTYPNRQWDAEQQDAIARVQSLRALRVLRDEFEKSLWKCGMERKLRSAELVSVQWNASGDRVTP